MVNVTTSGPKMKCTQKVKKTQKTANTWWDYHVVITKKVKTSLQVHRGIPMAFIECPLHCHWCFWSVIDAVTLWHIVCQCDLSRRKCRHLFVDPPTSPGPRQVARSVLGVPRLRAGWHTVPVLSHALPSKQFKTRTNMCRVALQMHFKWGISKMFAECKYMHCWIMKTCVPNYVVCCNNMQNCKWFFQQQCGVKCETVTYPLTVLLLKSNQ